MDNLDDLVKMFCLDIENLHHLYSGEAYHLLTRDEERTLFLQMASEDTEAARRAKQRLVECNTRLVISIARRYVGYGVPFSDLVSEGNIGLLKAIEKFDLARGVRLSTYATWWIRQAVGRAVVDQGRTIRLPVHISDQCKRIANMIGAGLTYPQIAEEMSVPEDEIEKIIDLEEQSRSFSMDREINKSAPGKDDTYHVILPSDDMPPEDMASLKELSEVVEDALDTLTSIESKILTLRYGLDGQPPLTLEEVGKKFARTRERIRQIEAGALHKLRHPRRARKFKEFV